MIRIFIGVALLAASLELRAAPPKTAFDILVQAQDCSTTIRVPSSIKIGLDSPEIFRTESLSRRFLIVLEVSLTSQDVFRVRGSFLTACGDIAVDSSASIGKAATVKSGKLWLKVTLVPAANNSFKPKPLRGSA